MVEPLQNGVSRRFERQCDRYALRRRAAARLFSAFRKLARLNKDDPDPHWLEVLLFHSHPPIAQRLALADQSAATHNRRRGRAGASAGSQPAAAEIP